MAEDPYSFGPYRLDLARECILKNERLHCWRSKLHFSLLKLLIDAEPDIVTFDRFIKEVWRGQDRTMHNVGENIRLLKLCIAGCSDHIKTHPREGYSFDRAPKRPTFDEGTAIEFQAAKLYAVAHAEWTRRTRDSVKRALDLFRELEELQPENARAHLGIAECLFLLSHVGFGILPVRTAIPEARTALDRALKLAAHDASIRAAVLSAIALISMASDWDLNAAETGFAEALMLDPNYSPAHHWKAHLLLYTDRWAEALEEIQLAGKLALNVPMVHATYGWFLYFTGDYNGAIKINEETVRLYKDFPAGYMMLGLAYEAAERYQDAIDAFTTSFGIDYRPTPLAALAHTYAISRRRRKAQQTLSELLSLKTTELVSPYFPAIVHAGLGNPDEALRLLGEARKERCDWLIQLSVDPRWKPLYGDSRFKKLMRQIGVGRPQNTPSAST